MLQAPRSEHALPLDPTPPGAAHLPTAAAGATRAGCTTRHCPPQQTWRGAGCFIVSARRPLASAACSAPRCRRRALARPCASSCWQTSARHRPFRSRTNARRNALQGAIEQNWSAWLQESSPALAVRLVCCLHLNHQRIALAVCTLHVAHVCNMRTRHKQPCHIPPHPPSAPYAPTRYDWSPAFAANSSKLLHTFAKEDAHMALLLGACAAGQVAVGWCRGGLCQRACRVRWSTLTCKEHTIVQVDAPPARLHSLRLKPHHYSQTATLASPVHCPPRVVRGFVVCKRLCSRLGRVLHAVPASLCPLAGHGRDR